MGFPRSGGVRAATGGVSRGGRGTGGGSGGFFGRGPSEDFVPVPKERRGQTIRRILVFFKPYRPQIAVVLIAIVMTSFLGLVNPYLLKLLIDEAIPQRDLRLLTLYVGLMIVLPIITRPHRRRPVLPQQPHRPARHAGPAQRAVRAPAADAAALLHRDAHGRDPEPPGQRRRRRPVGRHRHGQFRDVQPGHRRQHDRRDVADRLAADRPVARAAAVLHVPDLPRRQGPPRGRRARPRSRWPTCRR